MKNVLVIYRSKTGFTREYAEQIAGELHCRALPFESMTDRDIAGADILDIGSRVHAGRVDGLRKMMRKLFGKDSERSRKVTCKCRIIANKTDLVIRLKQIYS